MKKNIESVPPIYANTINCPEDAASRIPACLVATGEVTGKEQHLPGGMDFPVGGGV